MLSSGFFNEGFSLKVDKLRLIWGSESELEVESESELYSESESESEYEQE